MDNKRLIKIIKILSQSQHPVKGQELCEELGVTVRTLRNDIKEYRQELKKHGLEIVSKHAVGYSLKIYNEEDLKCFIIRIANNDDILAKERNKICSLVHKYKDGNSTVRTVDYIISELQR